MRKQWHVVDEEESIFGNLAEWDETIKEYLSVNGTEKYLDMEDKEFGAITVLKVHNFGYYMECDIKMVREAYQHLV